MLKQILIFGAGVAAGSVATYYLVKKKFQKIADEEIESMKEYYTEKYNDSETENVESIEEKKDSIVYESAVSNYRPKKSSYYNDPRIPIRDDPPSEPVTEPYSITPDQFANEKRNFEKVTLYYYEKNDVLCDESDRMKESIEASIGRENLKAFGEYEDDVAYIRNERLGIDYEVLLQHGAYKPPYPTEDDIY